MSRKKLAWKAPQGSLHPKPGTPEASAHLDGFTVGDLVVVENLPGNGWQQSLYHWTHGDNPVQKVGEIIRLRLDTAMYTVCHEQAEYICVTAVQMRHATRDEIRTDYRRREAREQRYNALKSDD